MKKLVIGNWKMYPTLSDGLVLATTLRQKMTEIKGVDVAIAPPASWLVPIKLAWKHRLDNLHLAAQNVWAEDQGAFTGEISAFMLKDIVSYAILGHSERREFLDEDSELVAEKVQSCLKWGITPVVCVGEGKKVLLSDGSVNTAQWARLQEQLLESLRGVKADQLAKVVIAYEPVWAISTHHPTAAASPAYVEAVIGKLRSALSKRLTSGAAGQVRFLYGGSVTAATAGDYLRQQEVAGLLVGRASVNGREFAEICALAARIG